MRLAAPPPPIRWTPTGDALALAMEVAVDALARHEAQLSRMLADLGDIDLPDTAPAAQDRARLQAAAPLYLAAQLEDAGVLPAAETVAGLFASGAVNQSLGAAASLLHAFWRHRRERLDANERAAIFARVFEGAAFDRLMRPLCEAIVAQADGADIRDQVALATAAQQVAAHLAQRVDAMAAMAARDIVDALNLALAFLRDRALLVAFGVPSLWSLLSLPGMHARAGAVAPQSALDRGRAGQTVLLWVAQRGGDGAIGLDPATDAGRDLVLAAQRWLTVAAPAQVSPPAVAAALSVVD